jgi:hypothetical protein
LRTALPLLTLWRASFGKASAGKVFWVGRESVMVYTVSAFEGPIFGGTLWGFCRY